MRIVRCADVGYCSGPTLGAGTERCASDLRRRVEGTRPPRASPRLSLVALGVHCRRSGGLRTGGTTVRRGWRQFRRPESRPRPRLAPPNLLRAVGSSADDRRMGTVKVEYTKWDGRAHWRFDLNELGTDAHGLWLGGERGCRLQRGDEAPIYAPHGFVCLVPTIGTWIASFYVDGDVYVYIDVTNDPVRSGDCVKAIDLDLDVVRWRDGRVVIEDEDEFIEHRELFGYPNDVTAKAEATATDLAEVVRAGVEPFGTAPAGWLARVG